MENITPPQMETPIYVLPQNKVRALIPKFITFLVLGAIFYLGVMLNLSLLELTSSAEATVQIVSLTLLFAIILLGVYLAFHRANQAFKFYRNRVWIHKKELYYINITTIAQKRDFWDKLFKTYQVGLGNGFYLRHISNSIQVTDYIQQLVTYAKNQPLS